MKLYVKRDQDRQIKQCKIVINSMSELTTIRLALDAKIGYCQDWLKKSDRDEDKQFWASELESYVKAFHAVDVANGHDWEGR